MRQGISDQTVKKYYNQKTKGPGSKEVSSKTNEMQLIIPLMKPPVNTQTSVIESSLPDNVSSESSMDNDVIESSLDNAIPDNVFEEIMAGLRQDPDLQSIFDDLDIDDLDIDMEIEETSPLERELMHN